MTQEDYYNRLESQLDDIWSIASEAREAGEDPEPEIEIKLSEDMAERTEMFLEIDGLAERIRDLTEEGLDREEIAFELTDEFVNDELGDFDEPEERIDASIRTALAILTEAVVAAPLEGLQWVDTETDSSGREYIRLKYGGPIRSAGGTAQVVSVIIADYCRQHYGYDKFVPTDDEVERYVEEKDLYEREVGLQYTPGDDEVRTIIDNCPIMLDAEAVTEGEVSGYRDLERIETNGGRGGMCLVAFEGIAQKVPKLQKYTEELGLEGWDWLTELPNASKVDDSEEEEGEETEGEEDEDDGPLAGKKTKHGRLKVKPKSKYIDDTLTAGRPIFGHPSKEGAFRLRYGRARNTGHAAGGISPATMVVLNEYIAPGTQLKTERPGKAIAASPVDSLQGPTVKLKNGEMFRIDDEEEAHKYKDRVEKILDLGEIGVPYGEFLENNAQLVPSSYVHEWWMQDAEDAGLSASGLEPERLNAAQVWNMAEKYDIPLHPKYTYMWHDISLQEYVAISNAIKQSEETENGVELNDSVVGVLEDLLVPHKHDEEEEVIYLEEEHAMVLERCCDPSVVSDAEHIMDAVNKAAGIEIRERAPTRIGSRMGRPEKAEKRTFQRDLNIHTLFPVGDDVGRVITDAANAKNSHNQNLSGDADENEKNDLNPGETEVQLATRLCPSCNEDTHRVKCEDCGSRTVPHKECSKCGHDVIMDNEDMGESECPECGKEVTANKRKAFDIKERLDEALENLGERKGHFNSLKGVEGLVSQEKIPEPLEKGILRAKYDVGVYKDGTSRYDATDLPLTSFRPGEVGANVEDLKELGYTHDLDGEPLENEDQLVELKIQDLVIPDRAGEYLLQVANFIDDLLEKYYGLEPYYNADTKEDLIGELIIGMAPHTSAGALGRIIGYTDAWGQYAHPFFHAAKRRNCDSDEDAFMLALDGLLNYSEHYLNHHKSGWSMDEPIVMNKLVDPTEIDDEAHNVDIESLYSREFYEATMVGKGPKDVDVEIAEDRLDDPQGFKHALATESIDGGPEITEYKTLPDMDAKIHAQFDISTKARGVIVRDVAEKVIDGHFLADLKGNLRAFGEQSVRCTSCHHNHRRPPLDGICKRCGDDSSWTINVHEGSVTKYLDNMHELTDEYEISNYIRQVIDEYDRSIESLFENDKDKQTGLGDFV